MVNGKKVHCESDRHGLKLPDKEQQGNVPTLRRISIFVVLISSHIPAHTLQNRPSFLRIPGGNPSAPFFCRSKQDINRIARPASPVSHAGRYNTLHLASKVVCQRGVIGPFGNPPGFVGVLALKRILRPISSSPTNPRETVQACPYRLACTVSLFNLRARMKQADIKNLFSGCNHLIYGL